MPENNRESWSHAVLFARHVTGLGWNLKGDLDRDIPCPKLGTYKSGRVKAHGVDGLFEFTCPYGGGQRAVLLEGKRWAFRNVGLSNLQDWMRTLVKKVRDLQESPEELYELRGISPGTSLDTALVAWECHEGWDGTAGKTLVGRVRPGRATNPPILALISTNTQLTRLSTVANLKERVRYLEFGYINNRGLFSWSPVLSPEALHSSMMPIRTKEAADDRWEHGALVFAEQGAPNPAFLLQYLSSRQMLSHGKLGIQVAGPENVVQAVRQQVTSEVRSVEAQTGWSPPRFSVVPVPLVPFAS